MAISFSNVTAQYIPFRGGLNTETPPLSLPDGAVRAGDNYECNVNGGYTRIGGYERFSGQTAPSDAAYAVLNITLTGTIAVGNTITGVTSGATAVVLANVTTYLVITKIVGTFNASETLNVSGSPQATTTALAAIDGASSVLLHAQYKNLAADNYRADIAAVTGSGNILGGFYLNDVCYVFRNNAGGTAAILWKSTSSGWAVVDLFYELTFTAGSVEPAVGGTITQGGVSAVVKRVVMRTGTFAGGTAAGKFVIAAPTGGNFGAGALGGATTATASGIQTVISFLPGGSFEFDKYNFTGSASTARIYGADGVNRGFEFDGTVVVPITTGMTTDTPTHVRGHKNHLFFSFAGSLQHSSIGFPYQWSVVTGASEIGLGDTITGMMPQSSSETTGAMAVFSRNKTSVLYGTSSSNWQLLEGIQETGAYSKTIQHIGFTVFLDDRGLTSLDASQAFGNYGSRTLSRNIRSHLNDKITAAAASCVNRNKTQYRIFFTDNTGYYMTIEGNKVVGIMSVVFKDAIECAWSAEKNDGTEVTFFGSDGGYVYQLDKGTSFDGESLNANLTISYAHSKSPRSNKRYRKAMFEIQGTGYAQFSFSYDLGYAVTTIPQPGSDTLTTSFTAGQWDVGNWDVLTWDGTSLTPSESSMTGTAENVSLKITSDQDYFSPLTFSGAIIHYTTRKQLR